MSTPKTNEEYVKSSNRCPFCDSHEIEGGTFGVDGGGCYQEVTCLNCGKAWYDDYDLVGYTELEE